MRGKLLYRKKNHISCIYTENIHPHPSLFDAYSQRILFDFLIYRFDNKP